MTKLKKAPKHERENYLPNLENVEHSQHRENVIYRDRSRIEELLLQLENKQQIMQNNVDTQHNRMYSLYIGS